MQSKKFSLIESITSTLIGFVINLSIQMFVVFPIFNIDVPFTTNFGVALLMTVVSVVRQYVIRRFFNKMT